MTASPDPKTASFGVTILYFLGFGLFLGALGVLQLGMDTGKWAESLFMLPVGLGIGLVTGSMAFSAPIRPLTLAAMMPCGASACFASRFAGPS